MREFAHATVAEVESHFQLPRSRWDDTSEEFPSDATVRFFLEEPATAGGYLYHAMVDLGGGSTSEPVFFGGPAEVPSAWLDATNIRLHFQASLEEFQAEGFLDAYFRDED